MVKGQDHARQQCQPKGVPHPYFKVDGYRLCPTRPTASYRPQNRRQPRPWHFVHADHLTAVCRRYGLRRHLSTDQWAYIAAKYLLPAEEAKARERQATSTGGDDPQPVENLPEAGGRARDLAAAQVGLSGKTVDAAARAIENGIPALNTALAEGRVSASLAAKISRLSPDLQESILADDNPKQARQDDKPWSL